MQEARREIVAATNRSAKVRIKGKEQFTEGAVVVMIYRVVNMPGLLHTQ